MKHLSKATLTAIAFTLAACGGGGGDETAFAPPASPNPAPTETTPTPPASPNPAPTETTPTPPASPNPAPTETDKTLIVGKNYTVKEVPLQTFYVEPNYTPGSLEAEVFAHANRVRSECGFGYFNSDSRLSQAADYHAKYLTAQAGDYSSSSHFQLNRSNTWYRGESPNNRATFFGYTDSFHVSEGLAFFGYIDPTMDPKLSIRFLMNAPYHGLDILAPRLHLAVGAQWSTKMGLINTNPAAQHGYQWGAIVQEYGTTSTNGHPNVQSLPKNDVLTWPCNATTDAVYPTFYGEDPNPLPNRDLLSQPTGSPFYIVSRLDSNLKINRIQLFDTRTGSEIPLMPVRYMRDEIYPGTGQRFSFDNYMDAAFVFPESPLPKGGSVRMEFTATVNGTNVIKSITYRVQNFN